MKITTPVDGYTGRTYIGPVILDFTNGVAEHDGDLTEGIRQYLDGQGYGIGRSAATPTAEHVEPVDPRDLGDGQVGSKLRDAAVDPQDGDFLAPTNAGQANPHGSTVVSPGIHALESLPIVPGLVPGDSGEQDAKETGLATAVLIERQNVGDATRAVAETVQDEQPKGNASREVWAAYAQAKGASDEDLFELSRDEIRDLYGA